MIYRSGDRGTLWTMLRIHVSSSGCWEYLVSVLRMTTRAVLGVFRTQLPQLNNVSDGGTLSVPMMPLDYYTLPELTPWTIFLSLTIVLLTWNLAQFFYNAYLHPLRSYSGPFAARCSDWWATYIEVWKKECMTQTLQRLHAQYGDVVRTAPNQLHFSTPRAYFDIYAPSIRWDKDKLLYHSMQVDKTSFGYLNYHDAKQRKDILQPLFSRRAVSSIQSLVRQKLDEMCTVLEQNQSSGQPSNMYLALRCLTVDTISAFCFGKSLNALSAPNFTAPIVEAMYRANPEFLPFKHLPSYRRLIWTLPPSIAVKFLPDTSGFAQISNLTQPQVDAAIADPASLAKYSHPTIYHRLLDPSSASHTSITRDELLQEAKNLIFAGTDTTANALYIALWHLMRNPTLQTRLRAELATIWPNLDDPPVYETLSTIPLLTAVIKESLRLSSGVVSPLTRIVPATGAVIAGYAVPPGTRVGMSAVFMHQNAEMFPDPKRFRPERWLGKSEGTGEMERHFVPFSRGPRSCLGVNLAWCELYLAVGTVVRRFEINVDEEGLEGVRVDEAGGLRWRDTFLPWFEGGKVRGWCRRVGS